MQRFSGGAWIDSLVVLNGGQWDVWSKVNLTLRRDTNKTNSSPETRTSPIIRVQNGSYHEITIPGKKRFKF